MQAGDQEQDGEGGEDSARDGGRDTENGSWHG
jgi:hypothetical protein